MRNSLSRFPFLFIFLAVASGLQVLPSDQVLGDEAKPIRILFLGGESHHDTKGMFQTVSAHFDKSGIESTYIEDSKELTEARLQGYDAVMIYRDGGILLPDNEKALLGFVEQGKGLVVVHCGSHCFRNSAAYTKLVGGRFLKHETEVFQPTIIDAQHPAMRGVTSLEAWDETYVHNELGKDLRVLMVREHAAGREPWTWVRNQGKGRVFYTASGHDERSWRAPGYAEMLTSGVRWVSKREEEHVPTLSQQPAKVPKYVGGGKTENLAVMQTPLSPADSMSHYHYPAGMRLELFASEPDVIKPIAMNFDDRGRLWVIESVDYPNDVVANPHVNGNDRIKICEDTNGDGKADKFTIFADKLNIPTSLAFARGGVLVAAPPYILFMKDTDGDDRADTRDILYEGFGRFDTHAVLSNIHYGLDNWYYASVGYSGGKIKTGSQVSEFGQGFFRFGGNGKRFEVLTRTSNNTWGLGIHPAGEIFGSTANNEHAVHLAIPNRYFESVRGWHGQGSSGIEDHKLFHPVTEDVRQVDWFGGFTAASGYELYTARSYPKPYWDRTALICEPTGHLVHVDVLVPSGSGYVASDGYNLLASSDAWSAPIAAQVGPDGAVWVLDWYNFIVQHNPTPAGFENGPGNAYITPLRDKLHGRVYRLVANESAGNTAKPTKTLAGATPAQLVKTLGDDNLFWRLQAQRLLVERGNADIAPELWKVAAGDDPVAASHAIYTLSGLGGLENIEADQKTVLKRGLEGDNPSLRRAVLSSLPKTDSSSDVILAASGKLSKELGDLRAALLTIAEMPSSPKVARHLVEFTADERIARDRWLPLALAAAAAKNERYFIDEALGRSGEASALLARTLKIVAEHWARGESIGEVNGHLARIAHAPRPLAMAFLEGLEAGLPERPVDTHLNPAAATSLLQFSEKLTPEEQLRVVHVAKRLGGAEKLEARLSDILNGLAEKALGENASIDERVSAARSLMGATESEATIDRITSMIDSKSAPELFSGVLDATTQSAHDHTGEALLARLGFLSPNARRDVVNVLLKRPNWTRRLVDAISNRSIAATDLALDQVQQLLQHPDRKLADAARKALGAGSAIPDANRQKVLDQLAHLANSEGDATRGKAVFKQQCGKCHVHTGEGGKIGPDLTGMSTHPKAELLVHILDPSRSVEGNYRQYTAVTSEGKIFSGLLSGDTRTSIELLDAEGKRQVILREDLEEFRAMPKSIMPEGFEKMPETEFADLLAFMTKRGKYIPLPLDKIATVVTTRGMFYSEDAEVERLVFEDWEPKNARGVPFQLVDPQQGLRANAILLNSPNGTIPPKMPKSVGLPCRASAKAIHILGGVAGWAYPYSSEKSTSMIVRLQYANGKTEDHELKNGEHIADYIRRVDVPKSEFAFDLRGQQLRFLSVFPSQLDTIESIEFVKGTDDTAPIVMAVTLETVETK